MIYFVVKGPGRLKINIMCELYMFLFSSSSQGPRRRSVHAAIVRTSVPLTFCSGSVRFFSRRIWVFDLFNKHVEKDSLQHGLGTPYSNSACFDKDDIWNFCSFLYSACPRHLLFSSPPPSIELKDKTTELYLTFLDKHSTPKVMVRFRFLRRKKKSDE